MKSNRRRTVFIVNPTSAGGLARKQIEKERRLISQLFEDSEVLLTDAPKHATHLTREALNQGASTVVAVGGDGTANEVANGFFEVEGLIRERASMGILMVGTGGDLRRTLNLPKDLRLSLKELKDKTPQKVDVGLVTYRNDADETLQRYFLNISSVGLSAEVARLVHENRKNKGKLSYYLLTLKTLLGYEATLFEVTVDGVTWNLPPCSLVAFANAQYFGGGMKLAPNANMKDGLADIIAITQFNLPFFVRHGHRVYFGRHLDLPQVHTKRGAQLTLSCIDKDVHVEADGELLGRLPATFEIIKEAISLIY